MPNFRECHTDHSMLGALQAISHQRVTYERYEAKSVVVGNQLPIWSQACLTLMKQDGWPFFFGMLWPNKSLQEHTNVTVLQNTDTLAATLAIRAGVEVPTAIALASRDLIFVARIDRQGGSDDRTLSASLCGTFSMSGAGDMFRYALFAKPEARFYRPEYQRDELLLMRDDGEDGVHWGRDFSIEYLVHQLWDFSTDESLRVQPSPSGKGVQDA